LPFLRKKSRSREDKKKAKKSSSKYQK